MFEALKIIPRPDQYSQGVSAPIDWNRRWQGLIEQQRVRDALQEQHDRARHDLRHHLNGIYLKHGEQGDFNSGAVLNVCVEVFEKHADNLIECLVDTWEKLAPDPETYALVSESTEDFLALLDDELAAVALRVNRDSEYSSSVSEMLLASQKLWAEKCARFLDRLEKRFFECAELDEGPEADRGHDVNGTDQPTPDHQAIEQRKNAMSTQLPFQDLWLEIALQLWTGSLRPTAQSDLDQAMTAWFDQQGIAFNEAEVHEASRRLWRKYVATRRIITNVACPENEGPMGQSTVRFDRFSAPPASKFSFAFANDVKPGHASAVLVPSDPLHVPGLFDGDTGLAERKDLTGVRPNQPEAFNLGMEPKIGLSGLELELD